MKKLIYFLPLFLFGCEPSQNEDVVQNLTKDGSIEVEISTKHETGFDVMTTIERIWVKNQLHKTLYHIDTIPFLGYTSQYGETGDGNDTLVTLPRDYEFFITVK